MPYTPPVNTLPPGLQRGLTVPEVFDQPSVQVRIDYGTTQRWAHGTAQAWTRAAVFVRWSDPADRLQRLDWFPAGDVRRD